MIGSAPEILQKIFRVIVAWRWRVVLLYALLLPAGIYLALQVRTDNSIASLIVEDDLDYQESQAFRKIFSEGEHAILLVEANDPFAADVVGKVKEIEGLLSRIPRVGTFSALDLHERTRALAAGGQNAQGDFRAFATGTRLFA